MDKNTLIFIILLIQDGYQLMRNYFIIILLIIFTSNISADEVWTTYPLKIQALAVEGDYIWLAQGNKIFKWNKQEGITAQFTNKNGKTDQWIGEMIIEKNGKI